MKKIILSLVAIMGVYSISIAQDRSFKFGVKAGINLSDANIENAKNIEDIKTENLTGFHIGAVAEIFLSDHFSIQPELMYSAQGNNLKAVINETKVDIKNKIDYLTVPIMLKYYMIGGLNINAGPQVGFNVKSTSGGENNSDSVNKLDFGLNFGVGYESPIGLFIDARYNLGLTNITKDSFKNKENFDGIGIAKSKVIQLSVGLKF